MTVSQATSSAVSRATVARTASSRERGTHLFAVIGSGRVKRSRSIWQRSSFRGADFLVRGMFWQAEVMESGEQNQVKSEVLSPERSEAKRRGEHLGFYLIRSGAGQSRSRRQNIPRNSKPAPRNERSGRQIDRDLLLFGFLRPGRFCCLGTPIYVVNPLTPTAP